LKKSVEFPTITLINNGIHIVIVAGNKYQPTNNVSSARIKHKYIYNISPCDPNQRRAKFIDEVSIGSNYGSETL